MLARVRRFFDIRPGEMLPVLLTFFYIAAVIAAFLLAKAIRSGLFLKEYGAYALPYVYAAVPLAVTAFVPISTRLTNRYGQRTVAVWTLVFFAFNVLLFWYAFRVWSWNVLPAVLYVWVNCFGIIAPVQAWSFANSLFDTRQAKRLFGVVGAGASLGAILGGFLARVLVDLVGGPVNLLLVLAGLIFGVRGDRPVCEYASPAAGRAPPEHEHREGPPVQPDAGGDRAHAVSAPDCAHGLSGGDLDAVEHVSAQRRGRSTVRRRRRRTDAVLRHLQLRAGHRQLHRAVDADRYRTPAVRRRVHDHAPAGRAQPRRVLHPAVSRLLDGADDQRDGPGAPVLGGQGHLRAAVSADRAGLARPYQERHRHRAQSHGGRRRGHHARSGHAWIRRPARLPAWRARHRRDQPLFPCRLVRRGLAGAWGIRPHDSATRFTFSGSTPSGPQRTTSIGRRWRPSASSSTPTIPTM